jgi:hypothetical protein
VQARQRWYGPQRRIQVRRMRIWRWCMRIRRGEEAAHADPARSGLGSGGTVRDSGSRRGSCQRRHGAAASGSALGPDPFTESGLFFVLLF